VSAGKEPVVRVGLVVDSAQAVVSATTAFDIAVAGGDVILSPAPTQQVTITSDEAGNLTATAEDGRAKGPFAAPLIVRPRKGGAVLVSGRSYRGEALVRAAGNGHVTAMNVVDLEHYLLGVVPLEIGIRPATEIEAVKAQAIAARTYAIGNLNGRQTRGFDFYATVDDQVYGGLSREDTITSRAVTETAGEIITYQDQPILAYYHSTCGGRTAAIEESWRNRPPQPYLKSVSDQIPGSDKAYCDISNRYRWSVKWTAEQLRSILATTLSATMGAPPVQRIENIEQTGTTPSGRVDAMRITADGRTYVVRGDSVRWVLRPTPNLLLNSSLLLDVHPTVEDGAVSSLEVKGGGWGHGIGMCQWGAIGRARAGQSYRQILGTYYQGTQVSRLYKN
jgi:stage II sporulation protein D